MRIALDYDDTYTADPELWDKFIDLCGKKHEVWIVTMRHPTEPLELGRSMRVMFTSRQAKMEYCLERGMVFDIWIDDKPHWILEDG